ncbi:phage portal protein, partial [Clostridium thailandense]|uniref:phage portal protein n=1 Tax=Clostridium thailandense TaxID=2794346 RepID=UPI001FE82A6E
CLLHYRHLRPTVNLCSGIYLHSSSTINTFDKSKVFKCVFQNVNISLRISGVCIYINFVSSAVSKCEFKTYINNKEVKGDEYYLWNIEPNKNQNSSQFIQEFISKLLYDNECLVIEINGQLIAADSFYQNEYDTLENFFTNMTKETMNFDRSFKMSDVMYFKLENEDSRALLSNLLKGL